MRPLAVCMVLARSHGVDLLCSVAHQRIRASPALVISQTIAWASVTQRAPVAGRPAVWGEQLASTCTMLPGGARQPYDVNITVLD